MFTRRRKLPLALLIVDLIIVALGIIWLSLLRYFQSLELALIVIMFVVALFIVRLVIYPSFISTRPSQDNMFKNWTRKHWAGFFLVLAVAALLHYCLSCVIFSYPHLVRSFIYTSIWLLIVVIAALIYSKKEGTETVLR
jgi:FtsH-binding integral membrane protein